MENTIEQTVEQTKAPAKQRTKASTSKPPVLDNQSNILIKGQKTGLAALPSKKDGLVYLVISKPYKFIDKQGVVTDQIVLWSGKKTLFTEKLVAAFL